MKIFNKKPNEVLEPLLIHRIDPVIENKEMGSEKWHKILRAVGPHLAGQGNTIGFLDRTDSFKIKTLTKETLGEVAIQSWRGLHQDSQQNCYTCLYLTKPWELTYDPCDLEDNQGAYSVLWAPCWIGICPLTLTASILSSCIGAFRDVYNFSKSGLIRPLKDKDNKGIPLGLFYKNSVQGSETQVMQDEHIHAPGV